MKRNRKQKSTALSRLLLAKAKKRGIPVTGRQALSVARDWDRFLHRNHYKPKEHYVLMFDAIKMSDEFYRDMSLDLIRRMRDEKKQVSVINSMRPFRKDILGYALRHEGDRLIAKRNILITEFGAIV